MRCPACGNENRAGARFCARCGEPLPPAQPAVEAPPPSAEASQDEEGPSELIGEPATSEGVDEALAVGDLVQADAGQAPPVAQGTPPETPAEESPSLDQAGGPQPTAAVAAEEQTAAAMAPEPPSPAPTAAPLAAGSQLQDRYEIIELLESSEAGNLYRAYDLRRCPRCGYTGNRPRSEYCAECGATIAEPVICTIRETKAAKEPSVAEQFTEGDQLYTVILEKPAGEAEEGEALFPAGVRLRWGKQTDVGKARQLNEDSLDARVYAPHTGPVLGYFLVADGVGGQEHGEVASQAAVQAIWQQVRANIWEPEMAGLAILPDRLKEVLTQAVQAANETVYKLRVERGSDMGTTATAALLRDNLAVIANVGDSRAYRWSAEGLQRLTVDHSVVETLVASGRITRQQVYTHPQRNLIYRSLGDRPQIEVDTFTQALQPGDRLLLCSDGLWEMARDEGIEEVLMREANPQRACDELVRLANLAGGEDNITVIIVHVENND